MTTAEKIEAIREVCCAANPEIVALKFGCKFLTPPLKNMVWVVPLTTVPEDAIIIGRPIRLADVLLAMSKDHLNWTPDRMQKVYALLQGVEGWNLRADDLTLQEPATISFIYSILFNK